jgi:hypothetical protein
MGSPRLASLARPLAFWPQQQANKKKAAQAAASRY